MINDNEGDNLLEISIENGLEDLTQVPEVSRLHSFMRLLEDELDASGVDLFRNLAAETIDPSDDIRPKFDDTDEEEEYFTSFLEDQERPMESFPYDIPRDYSPPVAEPPSTPDLKSLYKGFTPKSVNTYKYLQTPQSGVDEFLLALQRAGYTNLKATDATPPTGLTNFTYANFFDSALIDSPKDRSTNSSTTGISPVRLINDSALMGKTCNSVESSRRSLRGTENFTAESLRKNWDMDDEVEVQALDIERVISIARLKSEGLLLDPVISAKKPDEEFISVNLSPLTDRGLQCSVADISAISIPDDELMTDIRKASGDTYDGDEKDKNSNSIKDEVNEPTDSRIHSDFNVWSDGVMLGAEYIHSEYVGLQTTSLTHYNDNGKLILSSPRPKLNLDNTSTKSQNKLSDVSATNASSVNSNGGYYNLHVMECVIRPDVELKALMGIIVDISKEKNYKCVLLQRGHAVITPTRPSRQSVFGGNTAADSASSATASHHHADTVREWDQIDVQICISKQLRQRVMLLQFLRRISLFSGAGIGSLIINQISGPYENVPLKKCPTSKKFASQLKKELVSKQLSLSSLFTVPLTTVCSLPKGLDSHFLAQLHSLSRDNMWIRLSNEYQKMDEHMKEQEEITNTFIKTMEPIYKSYGLKVPEINYALLRVKSQAGETDESLINLNDSDLTLNPTDQREPVSPMSSPEKGRVGSNKTPQKSPFVVSPLSTGSISCFPNSPASPIKMPPGKVDGMTFALIMLDKSYEDIQNRCDEEYTMKVQRRHSSTLVYMQELALYKASVLTTLIRAPDTKASNISKSFCQSFGEILAASNNSSSSSNSSSNSSNSSSNSSLNKANSESNGSMSHNSVFGFFASRFSVGNNSSEGSASSLASPSAAGDQENAKPKSTSAENASIRGFKPPSARKVLTKEEVQQRVKDLDAISESYSPNSNTQQQQQQQLLVTQPIISSTTVLYYCAALISTTPGTVYFTQTHICVVSSILGLNQKREIYHLADLQDIVLPSIPNISATESPAGALSSSQSTPSVASTVTGSLTMLATVNTMRLKFVAPLNSSVSSLLISPVAVECSKVKLVIDEIKQSFR